MTESDVDRIERELKTAFPERYRQTLIDFPFAAFRGSDDAPLFDNPDALIAVNRQYRDGFAGLPPWPESLLFVGDDGAASTYVIDLTDSESCVLLLDHGNPQRILESCGPFCSWIDHLHTEYDQLSAQQISPPTPRRVLLLVLITIVFATGVGYVLSRIVL